MSQLQEKYETEIRAKFKEQNPEVNVMNIPRLKAVVITMGIAEAVKKDKKLHEKFREELSRIACQKPISIRATKSISNFKLREGDVVALKVTLRGKRMYEFLSRFFFLAAPRIKDFRGFSRTGFDGRGNYTLGLKEQIIFYEIDQNALAQFQGMHITFITNSPNDDEARVLLTELGLPFAKESK